MRSTAETYFKEQVESLDARIADLQDEITKRQGRQEATREAEQVLVLLLEARDVFRRGAELFKPGRLD